MRQVLTCPRLLSTVPMKQSVLTYLVALSILSMPSLEISAQLVVAAPEIRQVGSGSYSSGIETEHSVEQRSYRQDVDDGKEGYSLEFLESEALKRSPAVHQAHSRLRAEKWRLLQLGLPNNPEAGIDFQQLGSDGLAEQYGISVSQELIAPEKKRLSQSISHSEIKRLESDLNQIQQRVLTDIRMLHLRGLRAEKEVAITDHLVASAQKGLQLSTELLQAREVSRADVLQAEVEVESTLILNHRARESQEAAWREIMALTGVHRDPAKNLLGKLDALPSTLVYQDCLSQLLSQSPEVSSALAAIEIAKRKLERQSVESRPNVTVGGLFNWRDNGIGGGPNGGLTVSIPIPVWNKNQGGIGVAKSALAAAQKDLERTELRIASQLADTFKRYSIAADQVERYQSKILPKTEEMLDLTRQSFELGEVGYINLLAVQRAYANHQLAYLDALEILKMTHIEIDGMLLSESLSQP